MQRDRDGFSGDGETKSVSVGYPGCNDIGNALSRVASAIGNAITTAVNVVVDTVESIVAAVVDLFNRLFRQTAITG